MLCYLIFLFFSTGKLEYKKNNVLERKRTRGRKKTRWQSNHVAFLCQSRVIQNTYFSQKSGRWKMEKNIQKEGLLSKTIEVIVTIDTCLLAKHLFWIWCITSQMHFFRIYDTYNRSIGAGEGEVRGKNFPPSSNLCNQTRNPGSSGKEFSHSSFIFLRYFSLQQSYRKYSFLSRIRRILYQSFLPFLRKERSFVTNWKMSRAKCTLSFLLN